MQNEGRTENERCSSCPLYYAKVALEFPDFASSPFLGPKTVSGPRLGGNPFIPPKIFLDDIFLIFFGSVHNLHMFLDELDTIHPTIKFTMSHTV